jgi:hypothetical protein
MTALEYQQYIRKQLLERAVAKYPNDTHKQMLYTIGFLQAQLAHAMYNDTNVAYGFKHRIKQ